VLNAQASLMVALDDRSSGVLSRATVLLNNFNAQVSDYEHPKNAEGVSMAALSAGDPEMAQSCSSHCHVGPSLTALEENRVAFTETAQGYITQAATQPVSLPSARSRMDTVANGVLQATDGLAKEERASLERVQVQLTAIQSSTQTLMLASAITAAILGLLLALTITRSITVPLANLVSISDKISTGELDTPVPVAAKDEIGELAESMERMRISIKALIERMRSRSGG
jgi:HAMP domain-containing protein